MKTLFSLLISFYSFAATAQVSKPAMLSLKGIGGNGTDLVLTPVTKTHDGGFIISYETTSTNGPIETFCGIPNPEIIFQKYNANASVIEWSKCYGGDGDSFLIYMFPQNDGGAVFGGEFNSSNDWGFYICKQDGLGNIIWSHSYREEQAHCFTI